MKAVDFFRALDDSDLDPYETRFLLRVWRRGQCWETLESIAATTGMSIGKASQVRNRLQELGWITMSKPGRKKVWEVALPGVETPPIDESEISPHEENLHQVKPEFHVVKPEFHVVHALPLIGQKEVDNTKGMSPADDDELARRVAIEATLELVSFWESLTRRSAPDRATPDFRDNWFKPFNEMWIVCGRDTEAAKARVQAVRHELLGRRVTIFNPQKLLAHVQAAVEIDLMPMTERMSGSAGAPADEEKDALWRRTLAALTGGAGIEDELLAAIKSIGGASRIKMADKFTERKVKEDLYHAYATHRRTATA